jgi:HEAT repeat protein
MQSQAKWRLYVGLILGLGVLTGVLVFQAPGRTPRYQGQSVRTWVLRAYAGTNVSAAFTAMGPAAVPVLVELLQTQELPWRRHLRLLAPKVPPRLRQRLFGKSDTPTAVKLRCGAALCLGLLGPQAESAAALLAQAMRDPELAVRSEAGSALARLGKAAVPHLTLALREPDPHVREASAFYLGGMGPAAAAAVPDLALALQDKETSVRVSAAIALGRIGPRAGAAVLALIQSLEDPDPRVRSNASVSLSAIGPPTVSALVKLIERGNPIVRGTATKVLVENSQALRKTTIMIAFRKMAQSEDAATRELALDTLGNLRANDDTTLRTLSAALKDPEPKVRLAAVKALLSISWKTEGVLTNLQTCLKDESPPVRVAAKEILDRIQGSNR